MKPITKLAGLPVNPFLLPLYFAQGKWTRLVTPRLPDAAGPTEGLITGAEPALRLIVIGDSTVAGVGAATHQSALTGQAAFHLARATQRAVRWRAVGQTHATTPVMRAKLLPLLTNETADVIVLSCGVNDTTRIHSPKQWQVNLRGLLADLRAQFGTIPIIHAGVPPLASFPALPRPLRYWIGARANCFAEIAQRVFADDANGHYCAMPANLTQSGFAADGYHPNEDACSLWGAELVAHLLREPKTRTQFV